MAQNQHKNLQKWRLAQWAFSEDSVRLGAKTLKNIIAPPPKNAESLSENRYKSRSFAVYYSCRFSTL